MKEERQAGRISSDVIVRRGREDDTAAMLRITADVWEGSDYVPYVWDEWLHDPTGSLQVATLHGVVVGFQHVALLPDGSAWLEGIRVTTDRRGAGIGAALLQAGIAWARDGACNAVRLATWSKNEASNRLARSAGLLVAGLFDRAEAPPGRGEVAGVRIALPFDQERVRAFIAASGQEFYTEGWTAYRLDDDRLRLLLGSNAVVVAGEGAIDAMAIATHTVERPTLRLGFLWGSEAGTAVLARWLRARAADAGLPVVRGPLMLNDKTREVLRAEGFDTEQTGAMVLHELRLSPPA